MGNQNTQFFMWWRMLSVENRTLTFHPYTNSSSSGLSFFDTAVLVERTQFHKLRLTQTVFDAQVPTLNVEFLVNGITYYNFAWANGDSPKEVDLSTTASNTLTPPNGDPPLDMMAGETLGFKITDGNRLNNSDRLHFKATLWGIRFPT